MFGFQSINPPQGDTAGILLGINDAGEVVGYYGATGNGALGQGFNATAPYGTSSFTTTLYPFAYSQFKEGAINNLGLFVGLLADDRGNRVGYVYDVSPPQGDEEVTLVQDPNTPAGELRAGTAYNELLGINDAGLAVGDRYEASSGTAYGYTYDFGTGVYAALTLVGASNVVPTGVNDADAICGSEVVGGVTEGFLDQGATVTTLTGPTGATSAQANALNNQGQVVGQYTDAAGNTHGFVYDVASGTYATVDDPNADGFTQIDGINDQGQIVGAYSAGGYLYGFLGTPQGGYESVSNPYPGSTIAPGYGSTGIVAGGSSPVTLLDPGYGGMTLFGNDANDTFLLQSNSGASGDLWVGGGGQNLFFDDSAGYATEQPTATIFLGDGSNTVVSDGETEVVASGGTDTLYNPRFAFAGDAGSRMTVASDTGASEVIGGAGTLTAFFDAAGAIAFGGSGQGTFVGAGDTFVVGDGPSAVYAGDGTGVYLEGSAPVTVDDTATQATDGLGIIASASAGADSFVLGSDTVYLSLGSGADTVFLGTGFDDVFAGSGPDSFQLNYATSGGEIELNGFRPGTDVIDLNGYPVATAEQAAASATIQGGSTYMLLGGAPQIDFVGLTGVPASVFGS